MASSARQRDARPIASVIGGLALGSLLFAAPLLERTGGREGCASLRQTGRPCLGCGGTRALRLFTDGELTAATGTNGLAAYSCLALLLLTVGSACAFIEGRLRVLGLVSLTLSALTPFVLVGWYVAWRLQAAAALGSS